MIRIKERSLAGVFLLLMLSLSSFHEVAEAWAPNPTTTTSTASTWSLASSRARLGRRRVNSARAWRSDNAKTTTASSSSRSSSWALAASAAATDTNNIRSSENDEYELTDTGYTAYPQQTPHSGRHFLPSHPYFRQKGEANPASKRKRIKAFLRKRFGRGRNSDPQQKFRAPSSRDAKQKRFMEGWYYRLTIPDEDASFAFIMSIEDPGRNVATGKDEQKSLKLAALQVMGPHDEYLVQADPDDTKFWAYESRQALGCTFGWKEGYGEADSSDGVPVPALHPDDWLQQVETGFQMLPNRLQGRMQGNDGTAGGINDGEPGYCDFDLQITPISGWGDSSKQFSTAGWLASYSVFEPHWQVTLADARASGSVTWKGKQYDVTDAPFYAEKNWGGAFPSKWYWIQCNSFTDGSQQEQARSYSGEDGALPTLSVTAGGGRRKLPFSFLGSNTEDLGMVSVHYNGTFYEAVPWTGTMQWDVSAWGQWKLSGRCTDAKNDKVFEAEVVAVCSQDAGVVLRAPTQDEGLEYFCKDSFLAQTTLSLWELEYDATSKEYRRGEVIIDKAVSSQGAVEVGGGPWWSPWRGVSRMKQPMKFLVGLPYRFSRR